MKQETLTIKYTEYENITELPKDEQALVEKAIEALKTSYAPYSLFKVGAALQLSSGEIITGSNQENSVSPLCLCAERVTIFTAKVAYPDGIIEKMAITAAAENFELEQPVVPCGSCRQVMVETMNRQNNIPFKLILHSPNGKIKIFYSVNDLLPFSFNETRLQNNF